MRARRIGSQPRLRSGAWRSAQLRVLGVTAAAVLLLSACAREEIVYIDPRESGHGGYTPFERSTSPRVHPDSHYTPADDVQIGGDLHAPAEYVPVAQQGSQWVHTDGENRAVAQFPLEYERMTGIGASAGFQVTGGGHGAAAGAPGAAAPALAAAAAKPDAPAIAGPKPPAPGAGPLLQQGGPMIGPATPAAKPGSGAAAPTPAPRLSLGTGLGATAGPNARQSANALALTDDDKDPDTATISGKVEGIVGPVVTVRTATGTANFKLADRARTDRDAVGSPTDLKPGQFVGIVQTPGGPATTIRLYATGPTMPRPGMAPIVGSRTGQITTFGSVVTLQFGGLLLNTGSETTTITVPAGVEILKAVPSDASAVTVGANIIATGVVGPDNTLQATSVRVVSGGNR
ncbi:MAG: hypothetical protein IT306_10965 [Chloroflexi bacterium]|nr:hypothetical protein [Chloroflexota bacterium]